MKMRESYEEMLTGGHPNSLGRTIEVVDDVLQHPASMSELFECYKSADAVVRLRVSNVMKRIEAEQHVLLLPFIDRFISEIGQLDQASAQWTLAQLFDRLSPHLSGPQRRAALKLMKRNLKNHTDWIVLNATMETLARWAKSDDALAQWLAPHLKRLSNDSRKSVSGRAKKKLQLLGIEN